uniref:histidine kinase n=1 Tax=Solibacter usitatus (strain Ellin6076) TaxID=234267 RepID=Q01ZT7_SOLUE
MGLAYSGDQDGPRLAALRNYRVLDTLEDAAFDRVTEMTARLFQAPIAVISFVEQSRLFFKSHFGLEISQISSHGSFCAHTILSNDVMVVPDAAKDPRFASAPVTVGGLRIRFYAGAPLITPAGYRLGALAVMDTRPRPALTEDETATLVDLAGLVMHDLNGRQELARARNLPGMAAEAEAKFTAFMESASQAIIAINHHGEIEVVNHKAEELFGYVREEMVGQRLELLLPDSLRHAHAAHRKDFFAHPHARPMGIGMDLAGQRKSGHQFPVEISLNHVEVGSRALAFAFITDITARLRLEQQLRQSQKLEAVGQLAGGVAHDFNNLLTVIHGYSSMSLDSLAADSPLREPIEEIEKAAVSAASLTRQLLAFSRRNVVRPQILNLNTVISHMQKMLVRVLGEDVELIMEMGAALDTIRADPGLIEQILMNLAVNSRDAMPHGGKLILETANLYLDKEYAGAHLAVKTGPHAMLAVTDTGSGMSEEIRSRIFEPFFTTKPQGQGTGLGLATVYGIVQQMEGSIWVYSEPGKGTTFKILFPSAEKGELADSAAQPRQVDTRGKEGILLVEDESAVRKFVRALLERQGYTVFEAADSDAAFKIANDPAATFDLLLTDVVMPRMNGPQIAAQIEAVRPGLRVLYMSGYTDRTIHLHDQIGIHSNFIQKPFTPAGLAQKLRELLTSSSDAQA